MHHRLPRTKKQAASAAPLSDERVEALREDGGAKEHDGSTAVLLIWRRRRRASAETKRDSEAAIHTTADARGNTAHELIQEVLVERHQLADQNDGWAVQA